MLHRNGLVFCPCPFVQHCATPGVEHFIGKNQLRFFRGVVSLKNMGPENLYSHMPEVVAGKTYEADELLRLKRHDLESFSLTELEDVYQSLREVLLKYQLKQVLPTTLEEAFNHSFGGGAKKEPRNREGMMKVYGVENIFVKLQSLPALQEQFLLRQKSLKEQQEVLGKEKLTKEERKKSLEKLVESEKKRLLEKWNSRKVKIRPYGPDDLAELQERERIILERNKYLTPQQREFNEELAQYESLLGAVLEDAKVLGEQSLVYPTDRYDDRIPGIDIVAQTKPGSPLLLIDLTHNFEETPDKLSNHLKSPIKKLGYPVDKSLDGVPGIPVVAGIGFDDLKEAVNRYVEDKMSGQQSGQWLEEFDLTLAETFIPQVEEQERQIKMPLGLDLGDVTPEEAEDVYRIILGDLKKIKGLHLDVYVDERNPWYQKLSRPLETIRQKYPDF